MEIWSLKKCPSKIVLHQKNAKKFELLLHLYQLISLYTQKDVWGLPNDPTYAPNCRTLKESRKVCCRVFGFHRLITSQYSTHKHHDAGCLLYDFLFLSSRGPIFWGLFFPGTIFPGFVSLHCSFLCNFIVSANFYYFFAFFWLENFLRNKSVIFNICTAAINKINSYRVHHIQVKIVDPCKLIVFLPEQELSKMY